MNRNTPKSEPRVADLLANLKSASEKIPTSFKSAAGEARSEKIELDGREQFFALRSRWSRLIIIWISCILGFQAMLTLGVGLKLFDFQHYEWFLPAVIGQSFLQIIGMGFVVVKFLYAEPK